MSDAMKWWEIERAVWERGPAEKARRAVLAQLAKHADAEGVTFVQERKICERSGFSASSVKRSIAALEYEGWITVQERAALVQTARGFERKGNLYRLDLVRLGLAIETKKGSDEGVGPAAASDEGGSPARTGRIGWEKPVQTSAARSHFDGGEVSNEARRGVKKGTPLINNSETEKQTKDPPYAPQRFHRVENPSADRAGIVPAEEENSGQPAEQHGQTKQPQRLADEYRGSGRLLVFGERPRRSREPRDPAAARARMNGEDAALWDEVTEVLRCCGVSPESSGRKQRQAIAEALRLAMREVRRSAGEAPGLSIAEAGEMARARWKEYRSCGPLMLAPSGVTKFFASGEWLNPQLWRFSLEGQDLLRRRGGL